MEKKLEKKKKIISVFFFLFSGKGARKTVFIIFQTQLLEGRGAKNVGGAINFSTIIEEREVCFCGGRTTLSETVNILFPWKRLVKKYSLFIEEKNGRFLRWTPQQLKHLYWVNILQTPFWFKWQQ